MPSFDFRCTACKKIFERSIPFGSKDYPICPTCGEASEKLISPPLGIVFKGQGFYKTDSSTTKKPIKKEEKAESNEKKTESPTKNSDAKTAQKADSATENGLKK